MTCRHGMRCRHDVIRHHGLTRLEDASRSGPTHPEHAQRLLQKHCFAPTASPLHCGVHRKGAGLRSEGAVQQTRSSLVIQAKLLLHVPENAQAFT